MELNSLFDLIVVFYYHNYKNTYMQYEGFHDFIEKLLNEEEYPPTTSELADWYRQISGDSISKL